MVGVRLFCEWIQVHLDDEEFLFNALEDVKERVFPELEVHSIPRRDGFLDIYVNMFPVDSWVASELMNVFSRIRFDTVREGSNGVMLECVVSYTDNVSG